MFSRRLMIGAGLGLATSGGILISTQKRASAATATDGPQKSKSPFPFQGPKWDFDWDLREPERLVSAKELEKAERNGGAAAVKELVQSKVPKATRNILLVRHGQYVLEGKTDAENCLTTLGKDQAAATGRRLAQLGLHFDRVTYSTQTRATETAKLILQEVDPENVASVRADMMVEEGAPYLVDPPVHHYTGRLIAEELLRESSRIEAAFRKYFHRARPEQTEDSTDLLVCHGNVTRYFLCRALQLPPEDWLRLSCAHGAITWIVIRPDGRVKLKAFGDSGHMPPDMITFQ